MTTIRLPDTLTYATIELASSPVTSSARAYGSEGWEFESLRARSRARCPWHRVVVGWSAPGFSDRCVRRHRRCDQARASVGEGAL